MMLVIRRAVAVVAAGCIGSLASAPAAVAETSDFAKNLGAEAKGVLVALFLCVAGLVALPILGRRDVNGGVILGLLVLILGGFAFAPGEVKHVITTIWQSLSS